MTIAEIGNSVRHGLRNLLHFSGRERRASFWPYAIFLVMLAYAASAILTVAAMSGAMMRTGETVASQFMAEGGAGPSPELIEQAILGMTDDLAGLWLPTAIIEAVAVALLAAAVARRLHDLGWRGWWGWLPVPFLAIGVAMMPATVDFQTGRHELSGTESLLVLAGYFSWVALALLALLLARRGDEGPNRFGPAPPA